MNYELIKPFLALAIVATVTIWGGHIYAADPHCSGGQPAHEPHHQGIDINRHRESAAWRCVEKQRNGYGFRQYGDSRSFLRELRYSQPSCRIHLWNCSRVGSIRHQGTNLFMSDKKSHVLEDIQSRLDRSGALEVDRLTAGKEVSHA